MAQNRRVTEPERQEAEKNSQDVGNWIFTNQSDENDEKYLLVISLKPGIVTQTEKFQHSAEHRAHTHTLRLLFRAKHDSQRLFKEIKCFRTPSNTLETAAFLHIID